MTPPAPPGTTPLGSGAGQQLLSAEKSHFATHVDITVKMIVEFQNMYVSKALDKLVIYLAPYMYQSKKS